MLITSVLLSKDTSVIYMYAFYVNLSLCAVFKKEELLGGVPLSPACDLIQTDFLWKNLVSLG